jgi:hypothetical protein
MTEFHATTIEATVVAELPQHLYRLEDLASCGELS